MRRTDGRTLALPDVPKHLRGLYSAIYIVYTHNNKWHTHITGKKKEKKIRVQYKYMYMYNYNFYHEIGMTRVLIRNSSQFLKNKIKHRQTTTTNRINHFCKLHFSLTQLFQMKSEVKKLDFSDDEL